MSARTISITLAEDDFSSRYSAFPVRQLVVTITNLYGHIGKSVAGSCAYSHGERKTDAPVHETVKHSAGEYPAKSAPFQDQCCVAINGQSDFIKKCYLDMANIRSFGRYLVGTQVKASYLERELGSMAYIKGKLTIVTGIKMRL